jgi:hypothetical protein
MFISVTSLKLENDSMKPKSKNMTEKILKKALAENSAKQNSKNTQIRQMLVELGQTWSNSVKFSQNHQVRQSILVKLIEFP